MRTQMRFKASKICTGTHLHAYAIDGSTCTRTSFRALVFERPLRRLQLSTSRSLPFLQALLASAWIVLAIVCACCAHDYANEHVNVHDHDRDAYLYEMNGAPHASGELELQELAIERPHGHNRVFEGLSGDADYGDPEFFSVLSEDDVSYLNTLADSELTKGSHVLWFNPHYNGLDAQARDALQRIADKLDSSHVYDDLRSYASIITIDPEEKHHVTSKYHNDACCEEDCGEWYRRFGDGRQWRTGVVVWLSTDYDGGHTEFVNLGLSVKGPVGWALKFDLLTKGTLFCDDLAIHRGEEVTRGIKRILTIIFLAPIAWMESLPGPGGYNATLAVYKLESRSAADVRVALPNQY